MKTLHTTILMLSVGMFFAAAEEPPAPLYPKSIYGNLSEETSAPPGLIAAIRENGSWKFKISAGSSGWNYVSSLDKAILRGEGYSIPLNTHPSLGLDGKSFVELTLSDEFVKTATFELWYSYSGRGGNRSTRHTINLSELTK